MTLILLGGALGLDSLRAAMVLGTMRLSTARQVRLALSFGLCDGLAPLVGLFLGPTLVQSLTPWARVLGPSLLVGYGLYQFLIPPGLDDADVEPDRGRWLVLGIPLFLSLDNLVAGFGLGMMQAPIVPTAAAIGAISGLMAFAGACIGARIGRALPLRAERVGGAALIVLSLALAFEIF
jgi:putative Mn2+ efflux pump MntP